jgi:hypothetical protein
MDSIRRRFGYGRGLSLAGASPAALLPQRLVCVRQLIGDDEGGEQKQPRFADLADTADELGDFGVDILTKAPYASFLPIVAGDRKRAAVHR